MAKAPNARALLIETTTTGALVECTNLKWEDALQIEDPNFISQDMTISFNGIAGTVGDRVTYARTATTNQKNNAVKARVNAILASIEPAAGTLSNSEIQVSGLPI